MEVEVTLAKQRSSPQRVNTAPRQQPKPAPDASVPRQRTTGASSRAAARAAAPAPQRISPVTIGLVALVVLAIAGFAIFYNQQRNATPTTASTAASGAPPVSLNEKGISQGVTPEGYPFKGNPDAKVVMEEFGDYQCPHCGTFATVVEPKIEEEFIKTGRVKFVFRDFQFLDRQSNGQPNPNGESHRASLAAFCAKDQGKYWEMHEMIFNNQGKQENKGAFSDANLAGFAAQLGLNVDTFNACLKNNASDVNKLIDRSMNDAKGKQVQGTPTFFINDRTVESGEYDTLKAAIELAEQAK
jgi:protein-disulfide isomerase